MARLKINWKHILLFLAVLGPGIITASVDNDAGGIATYSVAGANFGYTLLWTLIPITFILILVQEMCARMGAVTGKGLADLIRENFGIKLTFFILIGLLLANLFTTIAEFAGIAAALGIFGITKYIAVPLCALILWLIIVKSNYKTLEKIFLVICFFYVAYILSGIIAKPNWSEVTKALVIPTFSMSSAYILLFIAIIGTTITPWMQFYLQSSIVEKGIRPEDYKYSRYDVIIGCIITDIISFFIIVTTAAVLFKAGLRIETAADAAQALQPLAGNYAALLFAVGLFGAALFGAAILPLTTAYYICEGFGWESGVNKKWGEAPQFYTLLTAVMFVSALIVLIPKIPLIPLMIAAQVINGIILPVVLVAILYLINNKKIMGSFTNPKWYNAVCWTASAAIIALTILLVATTMFPAMF